MKRLDTLGKGSYYRLKDGRWMFAITIGYDGAGKQVRRTASGKTEAAMLKNRAKLLRKLESETTTLNDNTTVTEWMKSWLDNTASKRMSPRALAGYRSINRKHITPTLGAYRLGDVGAEEIRELHDAVAGTGVSQRTVQIAHSVLSIALRDAVREGLLLRNPADAVGRPRAVSEVRGSLSVVEVQRVLRVAPAHELGSMYTALLLTGARKAELRGMEGDRVHLDRRILDVSWQLQEIPYKHGADCQCAEGVKARWCPTREHDIPPGYVARECFGGQMFVRPKTAAGVRTAPIPEMLVPILPNVTSGLVWNRNGLPINQRYVTDGWHALLDDAGVPRVDMHSARHTTASLMLEAGVSPEVIAQTIGHSSAVSTKRYLHVDARQKHEAMNDLASLLRL